LRAVTRIKLCSPTFAAFVVKTEIVGGSESGGIEAKVGVDIDVV